VGQKRRASVTGTCMVCGRDTADLHLTSIPVTIDGQTCVGLVLYCHGCVRAGGGTVRLPVEQVFPGVDPARVALVVPE